jgi:hypothetical protein
VITKLKRYQEYIEQFRKLKRIDQLRFRMLWNERFPCLLDKTQKTDFDSHYVCHTAWAAKVLAGIKPSFHIDISSFIYFSTIVSAFIPIIFYDYRPANLRLANLSSEFADLMNLKFETQSINSISCMHVVEHIGLGRYGDPIDYDGDLKAISELKRVIASGGSLLFVVPIGKPKIVFNAHRIYSYEQVMSYFTEFRLVEFTLIPDNATECGMVINATQEMADVQSYGCGCFWFNRF